MSFDPWQIEAIAGPAPGLPRGIVAQGLRDARHRPDRERKRDTLAYLLHGVRSRPHFVAYHVNDLPASAPLLGTLRAGHAAADLDGALAEDRAARRALGRSDDLRGVSAVSASTCFGRWRRARKDVMSTGDLRIRVVPAIADISAAAWDACANPAADAASQEIAAKRLSGLANCSGVESVSQHATPSPATRTGQPTVESKSEPLNRSQRSTRRRAPLPSLAATRGGISFSTRRLQPLHFARFPLRARGLRLGRGAHRLAAAAPRRRDRATATSWASRRAI